MNRHVFGAVKRPVSRKDAEACMSSLDGMMREMNYDASSTGGLNRNYDDSGGTHIHVMGSLHGRENDLAHWNQVIVDSPLDLNECNPVHYIASYFNMLVYRINGDVDGSLDEFQKTIKDILSRKKKD